MPHTRRTVRHFARTSPLGKLAAYSVGSLILFLVVTLLSAREIPSWDEIVNVLFFHISWPELGIATLATLTRLLVAFVVCLAITFFFVVTILANRKLEPFMLPVLDVLQSVPELGFLPLAVAVFASSNVEFAAIIIVIIGMLWSILFGVVAGIHQIPKDIVDAAAMFRAKGLKYIWHVILPATFPALVTGSMVGWGAGWNVIIVAEWINFQGGIIALPGLGSLLDRAAYRPEGVDTVSFTVALATIVLVVLILNLSIWRILLKKTEKYKFE